MEDQRHGAFSSRAQSKTTLNELLDTLKLLEEEPERLSEPKCYRKEKYAWIDEVRLPQCNKSQQCCRSARTKAESHYIFLIIELHMLM